MRQARAADADHDALGRLRHVEVPERRKDHFVRADRLNGHLRGVVRHTLDHDLEITGLHAVEDLAHGIGQTAAVVQQVRGMWNREGSLPFGGEGSGLRHGNHAPYMGYTAAPCWSCRSRFGSDNTPAGFHNHKLLPSPSPYFHRSI